MSTLLIDKCPCCRAALVPAGSVGVQGNFVCKDCSRLINSYRTMKSRFNKRYGVISTEAAKGLLEKIDYLIELRRLGGMIPDSGTIDSLREDVVEYIKLMDAMTRDELAGQDLVDTTCHYCGHKTLLPINTPTNKRRCPVCKERYALYNNYRQRIIRLSLKECDDFDRVLNEYALQKERGYWGPAHLQRYKVVVAEQRKKLLRDMDK